MKITIDCPSKTHLMFINYVYRDDNFMMMACKSIETDMLYDGAEYKLDAVAFAPKEQTEQPTALSNASKEFQKDAEWLEQVGASSISLEEYKQRTSAILKKVDYNADTPQTDYPCDTCANKGDHDGECQNCVVDSAPIRWETPSHYKPKTTDCPWK